MRRPKVRSVCCTVCGILMTRRWANKYCETCCPDRASRHRLVRYGLSLQAFEALLWSRDSCCWICGIKCEGRNINVDHSHETGTVRGVLCVQCNHGLSFVERKGWLDSARKYLEGN